MLKIFVALSMLACSVIALNESQAIPAAPQLNGVPQVHYPSHVRGKNDIYNVKDDFQKAFPLAKTSPVKVIDDIVEGKTRYTIEVIDEFNKEFDSDKFTERGIHFDIIKRLGVGFGGYWGGLVGLSETPGQFLFGIDCDRSRRPDHYGIVMHKGPVVLYAYHINLQKLSNNVNKSLNESQVISAASRSERVWHHTFTHGVPRAKFEKAYYQAKTSPVEVIDNQVKGNNYTDYVIDEFNKAFTSDKYNSRDGIHHAVIRKLGDKVAGFWGGFVGLTEKPRSFYFHTDVDHHNSTSAPDNFHIVMHRGSFVLYVYYIKI